MVLVCKTIWEVKMKRILLSILVTGVLLLSACGAPTTAPPAEAPTPAPAETPSPTPEPAPTPAPEPEIKGVTTYFDGGYFYIVGEVLNTTNSNINFVEVVATFYDEAGTVIGTSFTYTGLDIITPSDAAPFEISS